MDLTENGTDSSGSNSDKEDPKNVGILALEIYFPSWYVDQVELEKDNGVSAGKYTVGLGQHGMAFTSDVEDINSISLTALANLLEKYDIDVNSIGRLEVGTETLLDKSKSTKTILMSLFGENCDVEGVTTINACYGGTAALLNSVAWIESSAWDGRFAVVIAADIAVYSNGPARPTGGCGAVAVLIGPDAPIALNSKCRASHATNVWDFYKPDMESEYPRVDGLLSQSCYMKSIDYCYKAFLKKKEKYERRSYVDVDSIDHYLFHSPYNKLVQKSFARLFLNDARRIQLSGSKIPNKYSCIESWLSLPIDETYSDKNLENVLKKLSSESYHKKVAPGCILSQNIGNTYTASVFANICCLVDKYGETLVDQHIAVFSYGSGSVATMYELIGRKTHSSFSLHRMSETLQLQKRMKEREKLSPSVLNETLALRESSHGKFPYSPIGPIECLFPGTYYLARILESGQREYSRFSTEATRKTYDLMRNAAPLLMREHPQDNKSQSLILPAVVTGISCGLPGQPHAFEADNMQRLLNGQCCIEELDASNISSLLEKNVVKVQRNNPIKTAVTDAGQSIKLAARLGSIDLTKYGVSASIAGTMDKAVQVAVAAGLEALKDSGLVRGGCNLEDWKLPEPLRDSTGIVYATSYPALDAAIGEVMRFLRSRCVTRAGKKRLVAALRERLEAHGSISAADEESLRKLEHAVLTKSSINLSEQLNVDTDSCDINEVYEFDRKFLFRVLVLGNGQLAQIIGARGPNMQTNAACAGCTQAVAMAQDMLSLGRASRIIVIAGDDASGSTLLPWIGNGFLALGAASIASTPKDAARPFDAQRNGLIIGSGAVGMVLESERVHRSIPTNNVKNKCVKLLETRISNSAFHGASMDAAHIAVEMKRFLASINKHYGITLPELVEHGVYLSHETGTHATPTASCAYNEVSALRECFGSLLTKLTIINTKGFTGHAMGVSFEDVAAVEVLRKQMLPPTANTIEVDPLLGQLKLSRGGSFNVKYALRFAAGFGSHVAFALYSLQDF